MFTNVDGGEDYEQDPRVTAVDAYTAYHLLSPSNIKYHDALDHAYFNSIEKGLPDIAVSRTQGQSLAVQARMTGAKNILEVGTLGGFSSIWFASAGDDVHVTSVEVDPHHKAVAEENIASAGLSGRIEVLLGPGLEVLPNLIQSVEDGKSDKFDFVFIDADKENSLNYFNLAMGMVKPRTCIYVDNVVRKGNLADEHSTDARVVGSRKLVETVGKDKRVAAVVLQTVSEKNYDGFLMAVVK